MVGPLPRPVCMVGIFVKNFYIHSLMMNNLIRNCCRLSIVFYFKSMPVMNDNFLSLFFNLAFTQASVIIIFAKFYSPGKPVLNELVCTGTFYDQWVLEESHKFSRIPYRFALLTILLRLVLYTAEKVWKTQDSASGNSNPVTIDGVRSAIAYSIFGAVGFVLVYTMTHFPAPSKLNESPNNLFIYAAHIITPVSFVFVFSLIHFGQNSNIQRAVLDKFFSN